MTGAELGAWIEELRRRHAAGEFKDHPTFHLLPEIGPIDVEKAVGSMLAEVDYCRGLSPERRRELEGRRRYLALQLEALRKRLNGEFLTDAEIMERRLQGPGCWVP